MAGCGRAGGTASIMTLIRFRDRHRLETTSCSETMLHNSLRAGPPRNDFVHGPISDATADAARQFTGTAMPAPASRTAS
jgi:hypothetical protein